MKKYCLSKYWQYFQLWLSSDFSEKNLNFRWKRQVYDLWNGVIRWTIYSKLASFNDFEKKLKFFSDKTYLFFFKNKQFSYGLRNLTISVAFYGKFAIIFWWKISGSEYYQLTNSVKNVGFGHFDEMIFLPYYEYGGK